MKLVSKKHKGSMFVLKYDQAQTPYQWDFQFEDSEEG